MRITSERPQSRTAELILAYLAENPNAQDTVEGIVEWWLLEEEIKHRQAEVKRALSELVDKGLVLERTGQDQRTRYQLNQERLADIQAPPNKE